MKGIIFNLLEEAVEAEHGAATWEMLLDKAGVGGVYTSLGNYPDGELLALVAAAATLLECPAKAVVGWFGQRAIPLLAARYPVFFVGHKSARAFLGTLNDVIHTEVRKIYPGARCPHFDLSTTGAGGEAPLVLDYHSERNLCALAEGMIEGAAAHYHEDVRIHQTRCKERGDDRCTLVCSFSVRAQ